MLALLVGGVAPPGAAASPFADAEAGIGYDSNLNAASSSSDTAGSVFGFGSAAIGVASAPARVRYQLAAQWSGTWYADYSDLSSNRISATGGLYGRLADAVIVTFTPSIGGSFYGDDDRDSLNVSARIGLRWSIHDRIALRPGYAILWQDANVSAFDSTTNRFSLGLDAEVWSGAWLYAGYALELTEVPRYFDLFVSGMAPGGGVPGGGPGSIPLAGNFTGTFGRVQVAVRTDATIHDLSLDLEQALTPLVYLRLDVGYSHVTADPAPYDVFYTSASLGVRWP